MIENEPSLPLLCLKKKSPPFPPFSFPLRLKRNRPLTTFFFPLKLRKEIAPFPSQPSPLRLKKKSPPYNRVCSKVRPIRAICFFLLFPRQNFVFALLSRVLIETKAKKQRKFSFFKIWNLNYLPFSKIFAIFCNFLSRKFENYFSNSKIKKTFWTTKNHHGNFWTKWVKSITENGMSDLKIFSKNFFNFEKKNEIRKRKKEKRGSVTQP